MSARLDPDPRRARVRVRVGAALVILLAALGVAVFVTAVTPRGSSTSLEASSRSAERGTPTELGGVADVPEETRSGAIYVHVVGLVVEPGLYELRQDSRVIDAIAAAGGLTEGADLSAVNLARRLVDGEQLVVPAVGQPPGEGAAGVLGSSDGAGRINLNLADEAALESLPRIGPAMAERIVRWRTANGPFGSVDELLSVSGIGPKIFDELRDLVTV